VGLRIALPPPTMGVFRDVFTTVTLYAISSYEHEYPQYSEEAKLGVSFDEERGIEFLEVTYEDFAQHLANLYAIKVPAGREPGEYIESILYQDWRFQYDPDTHTYRLKLGGSTFSIDPMARSVLDHVKFFFSRDVKTLASRAEQVKKGRPSPTRGFIDISFDQSMGSRVAWYLGRYMPLQVNVEGVGKQVYILATEVPLDYEARKTYASVLFESLITPRETKAGKALTLSDDCRRFLSTSLAHKDPDLTHYWLILFLTEKILRERIDETLFSSLPSIRVYALSRNDLKVCSMIEVGFGAVLSARHCVVKSAREMGVSPLDLVQGLKRGLDELAQASSSGDPDVSSTAEALKSKFRVAAREVLEGRGVSASGWLYSLIREAELASHRVPLVHRLAEVLANAVR